MVLGKNTPYIYIYYTAWDGLLLNTVELKITFSPKEKKNCILPKIQFASIVDF